MLLKDGLELSKQVYASGIIQLEFQLKSFGCKLYERRCKIRSTLPTLTTIEEKLPHTPNCCIDYFIASDTATLPLPLCAAALRAKYRSRAACTSIMRMFLSSSACACAFAFPCTFI
jgi:hypothetical protein